MSDEVGLEGQPAEQIAPPRRRRVRLVALAAVLVVVLGVIVVINWPRHHTELFCAGVGLTGLPAEATPDEAMAAYLAIAPDQPPMEAWKAVTDGSGEVSYRNTRNPPDRISTGGLGNHSVQVTQGPDGWSVSGACV